LVYGGWYGSGNIGDDAILIGLRDLLTEVIPDAEIAALSIDVAQTKRVCGVEAFPLKSPRELLFSPPGQGLMTYQRIFDWADACILTGGTPIYDYDHISRLIHLGVPRLIGKKLICFGIGVKPVPSLCGRFLVKRLMRYAGAISTRDRGSKSTLKAIGVGWEIRVTGDSALFMESKITGEPLSGPRTSTVAFCPRALSPRHRAHYHAPLTREAITRMRENMAAVADHVVKTGYDVVFLPMHRALGDDDCAEIAEIRGRMREPSMVVENVESPEAMMDLLGGMNAVFGMRLHALILAAMRGVPIVSVDYDPKIGGFMELVGAEEYLSRPEDKPGIMMKRMEAALDNAAMLRKTLLDKIELMKREIIAEAQRVAELIKRERRSISQ